MSAPKSDAGSAPPKRKFTMSLGKAKPTKKKKIKVQIEEEKEQRHAVQTLSSSTLKKLASKPKQQVVVVPLIKKNRWTASAASSSNQPTSSDDMPTLEKGDRSTNDEKKDNTDPDGDEAMSSRPDNKENQKGQMPQSLEAQAAQALIDAGSGKTAKKNADVEMDAIPLLVANRAPGTETLQDDDEKFRLDVVQRPDAPDLSAYERVGVEQIGTAMLRGMGWAPGKPIGKTNKQVVEPIEYLPRGMRLGLGAIAADKGKKKKRFIKPGESREEKQYMRVAPDEHGNVRHYRKINSDRLIPVHSLKLRVGCLVEVVAGPHRRLYGRVVKVAEPRCGVRLNLNQEVVQLPPDDFEILDEHALPKDHPAFNTADSVKKKKNKQKEQGSVKAESSSSSDKSKKKKKKSKKTRPVTWVVPHIRVRVVSKSLRDGKYYTKKGRINDIVDRFHFTMTMDDGVFVENVVERHVETALPKAGGRVMVVRGEHKGAVCRLLERNKKAQKAVVQDISEQTVHTLSFDDISEFVG